MGTVTESLHLSHNYDAERELTNDGMGFLTSEPTVNNTYLSKKNTMF